jgi:hypothetical protein
MPFRPPSTDLGRLVFLVICIVIAGLGPLYVWMNGKPRESAPPVADSRVAGRLEEALQEAAALRAENQMLLMMLGAVESRVMILGPTEEGGRGSGKIAWDEPRQAGFLYASQVLPLKEGRRYSLVGYAKNGGAVRCGEVMPDEMGRLRLAFQPERRLLGLSRFEVVDEPVLGKANGSRVILAGAVEVEP